jgi:lipoprotein NlpI
MRALVLILTALLGSGPLAFADETAAELLRRARAAQSRGHLDEALALADQAVARDAQSAPAYLLRGSLRGTRGLHAEAAADFTRALELDPKAAEAYNLRGAERFKQGQIQEAIADFDRYLERRPEATAGHWMRGIAYYYAERYREGRDQFAAYQAVDANDVENSVWHFLCNARLVGIEKARAAMPKIEHDRRKPMMEVYRLFQGRARPADVLGALPGAAPAEREQATFLAHLYLGIYYDVTGDRRQALTELSQAADGAKAGGYMGDVARVHLALLRKAGSRQ